ncbi:acetolactate synthase, large subunit [Rhizobiales bacterium GAS191]|nr:acetolactate synthase, large subunit [Rhizobiales bacterium GAS191]
MTMKVGEYLVGMLAENGVDTVFGIPGVHTLDLYRGLAGNRVRHVLTRHEQGAGFAADGYARISGRPGVCFLISGPGVGNAMTAMGQAYSDSVPMLVISSLCATDTLRKGRGVLHEVTDQRAMTAPVTAFSATALSAADLRDHLRQAFAQFAAGRPRPVHIEVPIDVLAAPAGLAPEAFGEPPAPPGPGTDLIEAAATQLRQAKRPMLIIGGGAARAGAAVARIAEASGALVVTTIAAKGVLPDEHPAHLGATLQWPEVRDLVATADLVLAAGTELAETDSYVDTVPLSGTLIRIDIDPGKLADRYRASLPILGDARLTLEAIAEQLAPGASAAQWACKASAIRGQVMAGLDRKTRTHAGLLQALRRALPADGAVFSDMTQIAYAGNALFPVERTRSWFHPCGYGTLGYALPAAIGGKIAAPDRPVVALAGDFGFQFTLPELATAVDERLTLPIIVWNNDRLGQIADDMAAGGIAEVGVRARNPDFVALAKAYGAHGVRASSLAAVEHTLREALHREGPTLVEIHERDFGEF